MFQTRIAAAIGIAALLAGCAAQQAQSDAPAGSESSGQPAVATTKPVAKPHVLHHGSRLRNNVALTLDADYSPSAKARVASGAYPRQVNQAAIDYLTSTGTAATIFATGMWAETYAADLKSLASHPNFEFGNHTWNHDAWTRTCYGLPYIGDDSAKRESLQQTNRAIAQQTGTVPFYVRMPGLCQSKDDERLMASEGLQTVNTDVSTTDAFATNAAATARKMLKSAKPGSILLMHLNGAPNAPVTADILKILVPGLKAKGLNPVTLSVLMGSGS